MALLLSACGGGDPAADFAERIAQATAADGRRHAQAAAAVQSQTAQASDFFEWAQWKWPQLVPAQGAVQVEREAAGQTFVVRLYATGLMVGISRLDNRIYVLVPGRADLLSLGALADFSAAIAADACSFRPGSCATPSSPLAGRAWTPMVQLVQGISDGIFLGVADDGRAVAITSTRTAIAGFPFVRDTPVVMLGEPGAAGAVIWSAPQNLSSLGARGGGAAPSDLRVLQLKVAPNGRAVVLASGTGGGCPGSEISSCRYVATLDPVQRTWSPWEVMAPFGISQAGDPQMEINSRGDIALFFPRAGFDPLSRVFWRGAGEPAFRVLELEARFEGFPSLLLTLDEGGGLAAAGGVIQNGTTDIVVWRGSIAAGFQPPVVVDARGAAASFRWMWTGRSGRSFVLWEQSNGTTNSLHGARFDAASTSIVAEDLGPALVSALPRQMAGTVTDADVLVGLRYNGNPRESSTCATVRWPFGGALELVDTAAPCRLASVVFNPSEWARERGGNVLALSGLAWSTYDAALNRQVDAQVDNSVVGGPGYVGGMRSVTGIRRSQVALSRSGIAVMVFSANLDTWPTPASPLGDGRPGVANLWASYFR